MAFIITTDGRTIEVKGEGENGTLTLDQMQRAVGGLIEKVPCDAADGLQVYCNEEGKLHGMEYNRLAADMANFHADLLVGNVLFMTDAEEG